MTQPFNVKNIIWGIRFYYAIYKFCNIHFVINKVQICNFVMYNVYMSTNNLVIWVQNFDPRFATFKLVKQ